MLMSGRFALLKLFVVLLAVGLLALAAVACSGGGDGDDTSQAGETPGADGGNGDEDGDGDGDGDGGVFGSDGLSGLRSLASAYTKGIVAKVTYKITTEADGETTEGEWVLVQRPPDSRIEISSTEAGEEFRTIIITVGGKSYLCFALGGEESCLVSEEEEAGDEASPLDILFDIPSAIAEGTEGVDIGDTSQRTIAGLDATCFTIGGGLADLGDGEVCFSDEGLLLYMQSEVAGMTSIFEATSVSTDVTDADFEPPYEILELPDLELPDLDLPDFDLSDLENLEDLDLD